MAELFGVNIVQAEKEEQAANEAKHAAAVTKDPEYQQQEQWNEAAQNEQVRKGGHHIYSNVFHNCYVY